MDMMQRRPCEQVERGDIRDELDLIGRAKTQQGEFRRNRTAGTSADALSVSSELGGLPRDVRILKGTKLWAVEKIGPQVINHWTNDRSLRSDTSWERALRGVREKPPPA